MPGLSAPRVIVARPVARVTKPVQARASSKPNTRTNNGRTKLDTLGPLGGKVISRSGVKLAKA